MGFSSWEFDCPQTALLASGGKDTSGLVSRYELGEELDTPPAWRRIMNDAMTSPGHHALEANLGELHSITVWGVVLPVNLVLGPDYIPRLREKDKHWSLEWRPISSLVGSIESSHLPAYSAAVRKACLAALGQPQGEPVHSILPGETANGSDWDDVDRDTFIVDSGAGNHVVNRLDAFVTLDPSRRGEIYTGAAQRIPTSGRGTIRVHVAKEDGSSAILERHDVIFAPSFRVNVLSVHREFEEGVTADFGQDPCLQRDDVRIPFDYMRGNYRLGFAIRNRVD